jgi:hypothetical protein
VGSEEGREAAAAAGDGQEEAPEVTGAPRAVLCCFWLLCPAW